jgi:hypothetical protein
LTPARNASFLRRMSNVLGDDKRHQIVALGRLGWSLRRIQEATGVRRETASAYLKAAAIAVRERGGRPRTWPPPKPATTPEVSTEPDRAKAATAREAVSTDSPAPEPGLAARSPDARKLPHTAAEDLLELIMRRYERASTALTSNRPVDDWGKLLGDTAAVTALLDRLLHHAHVLKCGPKSWRTKVHTDLRTEGPEA